METVVSSDKGHVVEYQLDIGRFLFYPTIMVGEFAEGVHVTKNNASKLIELTESFYRDTKQFVYISHRRHSYSMDTLAYGEVLKRFPHVKGIAIVSHNKYRRMLVSLEKLFLKKPIATFLTLHNATQWAEELLSDQVKF